MLGRGPCSNRPPTRRVHGPGCAGMAQETLLWHNNVLGLPVMLLMLLASGELRTVSSFPKLHDPWFLVRVRRKGRGGGCGWWG